MRLASPWRAAFDAATSSAAAERSTAVTCAWGRWWASAMAMAPEPVPTSRMRSGARNQLGLYHLVDDCFDQLLGLGARDEDGGRDAEREPIELLFAGDVLDRLVGKTALNQRVVRGLLRGRELAFGVGELRCVGDSQRVAKQKRGVAGGIGAQIG